MDGRIAQDHAPSVPRVQPGIVVFGHSMQLKYADEQARRLLSKRADHRMSGLEKTDLLVEIVKLGIRVRELESTLWDDDLLAQLGTQKTVRTTQGSFRLQAFGMPDHSCTAPQQIMIVIEDRQTAPRVRVGSGE